MGGRDLNKRRRGRERRTGLNLHTEKKVQLVLVSVHFKITLLGVKRRALIFIDKTRGKNA